MELHIFVYYYIYLDPERWRGQGETGDPRSRDDFPCLAQGTEVLGTHRVNDGVIPTLIDTRSA